MNTNTKTQCDQCNAAFTPSGCAAGYAIRAGKQICYTCADKAQRADLLDRSQTFVAYLAKNRVTTWTGGTLGTVTSRRDFKQWNNFAGLKIDRTVCTIRDIHGNYWTGRGTGDGMFIRMRPRKG